MTMLSTVERLPLFKASASSIDFAEKPLWIKGAALFENQLALVISNIIDPSCMTKLHNLLAPCEFDGYEVKRGQKDLAGQMITFLLSRPLLYRRLELMTGCGTLDSVFGRITCLTAGSDLKLRWHDDLKINPRHRLAITINLSTDNYTGGIFKLRKKNSNELSFSYQHNVKGDALIFKVDHALEHRVTPLTAGGPRIVWAGWFIGQ